MTARRRTALKRPREKFRPAAHEPGRGASQGKLRTAKPCGPGTRCWCQAGGDCRARPGFDRSLIHQRRRQDEFVSGESAPEAVKTTAQGRPGVPAHLRSVMCILAHDCGCRGHPAFPAPSAFERVSSMKNFGRYPRREIAMSYPVASHGKHAQRRSDGVPPPAPVCRRAALRMTPRLITCRHWMTGFY